MESPYRVTAPGGKVRLLVMNATEGLPSAFALLGTTAERKVAIRLAGGCKGMSVDEKMQMQAFFTTAFMGYKGLIWSGATRQTDKTGAIDPMVTDIPGVIAAVNPGCVALGTVPRVEMMTLQQESRLVLDQYGTFPNPSMLGILVVQNGADGTLDWDGDVKTYAALMNQWRDCGGFKSLGLISWNGGAVTKDEVIMSIKQGWVTILIKGTGRATDELVTEMEVGGNTFCEKNGLPSNWRTKTYTVQKDSPLELCAVLANCGFIG
jgi:hypothetical protein